MKMFDELIDCVIFCLSTLDFKIVITYLLILHDCFSYLT